MKASLAGEPHYVHHEALIDHDAILGSKSTCAACSGYGADFHWARGNGRTVYYWAHLQCQSEAMRIVTGRTRI